MHIYIFYVIFAGKDTSNLNLEDNMYFIKKIYVYKLNSRLKTSFFI